ncbi:MFS transporter [Desulfosporosinus fructosivorans]|uniref:MFS transporter n=1 Tax=Desulfosporosinus fructosivorans TaxID=2018669 RepID=A0A4Z0R9J2_9FIRM|nr:MFS transporter [Desulfosporosinus fructosivorans]TGE39114.1 MFS transporter [Desulfosporosinus fructosivorans]
MPSSERILNREFCLIWLVNFFIFISFQILIPTIPLFVSKIFHNDAIVGIVVGVYTFSAVLLRPISGKLMERPEAKAITVLGLLVFGFLSICYNFSSSLLVFFLIRIGHGALWGISTTATSAVAADAIPAMRRVEGMGYFTLSQNIAMAIGPGLGIYLISRFTFGKLFFCSMTFSVMAALTMLRVKAPKKTDISEGGILNLLEKAALAPSLILFCATMIQGAIVPFLPLYAGEKGVISYLGLYFATFATVLVLTRPFVGRLANRKGIYIVSLAGLMATVMALMLLCRLNTLTGLLASAVCWGLGFGAIHPLMMAAAIQLAPHNKAKATATIWTFFDLGIGIGAILAGYVAKYWGYEAIYLTFTMFPLSAMVLLISKRELFRPTPITTISNIS